MNISRSRNGWKKPEIRVRSGRTPAPHPNFGIFFNFREVLNIYFACSITGGRTYEAVYQEFTQTLLADRHVVPTAHLAESNIMALENVIDPHKVYDRDEAWIRACDALIFVNSY